jgi:phage gp36-like protein
MAYVSRTDLSERLGATLYARLTDRVSGAAADDAVADRIMAEAEAEADSYLALRYATPIDLTLHPELGEVLKQRVLDLAEYIAWRGSPFVADLPGRVQSLYAEARAWFSAVGTGRLSLPAVTPPAGRVAADDSPRYRASPRRFTAEELEGL